MQVGREALFLFFHGDKMLSERKRFRRSYLTIRKTSEILKNSEI